MALALKYAVEMQTTRKVLTVIDTSEGWNDTHYELPLYYAENPHGHKVTLKVGVEVTDKVTYGNFVLTHPVGYVAVDDELLRPHFGTAGTPIASPSELRYSLVLLPTGVLDLVSDLANADYDDYELLPDGIYTIEYIVSSGTDGLDPIVYKEEFVVTSAAEQVIEDMANEIADTILTCRDTNIDQIADYLVQEGLLFAAQKAAFISRKPRILNILDVINQD